MTAKTLSELDGGSEIRCLYERMESVVCAGPHLRGRDYTRENEAASEISKELHKKIKECVEKNGLDPSKEWRLSFGLGHEMVLQDW